jgi:peroxiredoxin
MLESMRRLAVLLALAVVIGSLFAEPVLALGTGAMAPEIGLKDMSGRGVSLTSLKGKVVLIDFWASWCAPCREELPVLEALYKKYRDRGFEVVAVNQDQSADNVRKFMTTTPLSFRVVHDRGGSVAGRYAPSKMPSSFIVDRKGIVRHVHAGFRSSERASLEKQIGALLNAK